MPGSEIRTETPAGRRRLTEDQRKHLSDVHKAKFAALTPEQQAAITARLRRGSGDPAKPKTAAAAPSSGAPVSPLDDAPGAVPPAARPVAPGASNGHDRASGPPIFHVPDLPPIETGPSLGPSTELVDIGAPVGPQVTERQVARMLKLPFALMARKRGRHWRLTDEEASSVAEPLADKLNENAVTARVVSLGGDWLVIGGGLGLLVWDRMEEDGRRDRASGDSGAPGGGDAQPGTGRVPPANRDQRREPDRRPDAGGGRGNGTLNGVVVGGASADEEAEALPAEAPVGPLVQAL